MVMVIHQNAPPAMRHTDLWEPTLAPKTGSNLKRVNLATAIFTLIPDAAAAAAAALAARGFVLMVHPRHATPTKTTTAMAMATVKVT